MLGKKGTTLVGLFFNSWARSFSQTAPSCGKAIVYSKHGKPEEVLSLENYTVDAPKNNQVKVKMLAAPVNYIDLWNIKGTTGKPVSKFPAVGGTEGLGIVSEPGKSGFQKGDWVIPKNPSAGTWKTEGLYEASDLIPIRNDIPEEFAAVLGVGPVTATRLLDDFVKLEAGDVIIQNAGSSLVAQTVMQLARERDVKVISIVRSRPGDHYGHLVERMKVFGSYLVVPEDVVNTPRFYDLISDLPAPKLALDAVGGKSTTNLARHLGENGTLVTYGHASHEPVYLPTGPFIFNNITVRGFDFNRWIASKSNEDLKTILGGLADKVHNEQLVFWLQRFELENYREAVERVYTQRDRKVILRLHEESSVETL